MWDIMWYLGFPMFAVSVFGSPYNKDNDFDTTYDRDRYNLVYDQRQNGTENYKVKVDGMSVVWTTNALMALSALLEPALYGELPESEIDTAFGTDQPSVSKPPKVEETSLQSKPTVESSVPTVLIVEGNGTLQGAAETTSRHKRKSLVSSLFKRLLGV